MKKNMRRMIADIEREVEYTRHLIGKRALDPRVMKAMEEVPREKFVAGNMRHLAFENGPLPIGHGQTISQPYIVALMSDLLQTQDDHVVLEIGTGSGYQTAILSRLVRQVYSIEVVSELGEASAGRLQDLGYTNVGCRIGNGYAGWPEHAPYDGIIVTAAATHIPPQLVDQLVVGGHLVIPVGKPYGAQELVVVTRGEGDHIDVRQILGVAFVPMQEETGGDG
ncbi:MAG: protein-L-isoaspartate(D-aspartate) O-methyltransferase [Thiohalobacterales bacterium]|nr:protein-L-isoaspartate(D-aspartate) O-methyltransferase [Thiohalobacterales bacterium]